MDAPAARALKKRGLVRIYSFFLILNNPNEAKIVESAEIVPKGARSGVCAQRARIVSYKARARGGLAYPQRHEPVLPRGLGRSVAEDRLDEVLQLQGQRFPGLQEGLVAALVVLRGDLLGDELHGDQPLRPRPRHDQDRDSGDSSRGPLPRHPSPPPGGQGESPSGEGRRGHPLLNMLIQPVLNDGFHPPEAPVQSASGGYSTGEESPIEIFQR